MLRNFCFWVVVLALVPSLAHPSDGLESLGEKLRPILQNYVEVHSWEDRISRSFQVGEVLEVFLSELKKEAFPVEVFLVGSALVNQCIEPIYSECNDIDVKIAYTGDELQPSEYFEKIDAALVRALGCLLSLQETSKKELAAFELKRSEPKQVAEGHFLSLRTFFPSQRDLSRQVQPTCVLGAVNDLPLQIAAHHFSLSQKGTFYDKSLYLGGVDSFRVPLDLFEGKLGSLGPSIYQMFSEELNLETAMDEAKRRIYRFSSGQCDRKRRWIRFLMKVTEGFSDPEAEIQNDFFVPFLKTSENLLDNFRNYIKKKRKILHYDLFFLINAAFHASSGDSLEETKDFEKQFDEEVFARLAEAGHLFHPLFELLSTYGPEFTRTLLKWVLPLLAEEISQKEHWGKKQMRCQFLQEGKPLYLLIPYLGEEDLPFLEKLFRDSKQLAQEFLEIWKEIPIQSQGIKKKLLASIWAFVQSKDVFRESLLRQEIERIRIFSEDSLYKGLQPILNNRVQAPVANHVSRQVFQVREVLHVFLSELKKGDFPFQVSLNGSSLINQCILPVYTECEDIDIKAVLCIDEARVLDVFSAVQETFRRTVSRLLGQELPLEDLSFRFRLFQKKNSHFITVRFQMAEGGSDLPLEFCFALIGKKEDHCFLSMSSSSSFFIKLDTFGDRLGSVGPDRYQLSSYEGDCFEAVQLLQQRVFTSENPQDVTAERWFRFIIEMTEGMSDPLRKNNLALYEASLQEPTIISYFKKYINRKKKTEEYLFFAGLNAFFHAREADKDRSVLSHSELFLQASIEAFSEKHADLKASPWIRCMALLCDHLPRNDVSACIQAVAPLWAEEVKRKKHLGLFQLDCRFVHRGKELYLWIPRLDRQEFSTIQSFFSQTSPFLFWMFLQKKFLFENHSLEDKQVIRGWIQCILQLKRPHDLEKFSPIPDFWKRESIKKRNFHG